MMKMVEIHGQEQLIGLIVKYHIVAGQVLRVIKQDM